MKLLIASKNLKKLNELETIFAGSLDPKLKKQLHLVSLRDFPDIEDIPEDGATFEENAAQKALGYAKLTGLLTLADDSGLSIDALNGAPGIYSARYAGKEKDDLANLNKVLEMMKDVPDDKRGARYECVIAIAEPNRLLGTVYGKVEGVIARKPSGSGGFGYDPIFYYPSFKKTFGEIEQQDKDKISHRMKAILKSQVLISKQLVTIL